MTRIRTELEYSGAVRVAAVILAAGRSRRMGRAKALLPLGDDTFVGRLVRLSREVGLEPVRVVVGEHRDIVAEAHPELEAVLVRNPQPELGQLHSLRLGLQSLHPAPDAVVMMPVDHPLVAPATVAALVTVFRGGAGTIVLPVHEGRRGHPVLFGREVFGELLGGPLEGGARTVVRADAGRVVEVAVDDRGILVDIDTREEYREALGDERAR